MGKSLTLSYMPLTDQNITTEYITVLMPIFPDFNIFLCCFPLYMRTGSLISIKYFEYLLENPVNTSNLDVISINLYICFLLHAFTTFYCGRGLCFLSIAV